MKVKFRKGLDKAFVKQAKADFPVEYLVGLLGREVAEGSYVVDEIVSPLDEEVEREPNGNWVDLKDAFLKRVGQLAEEKGLLFLGDLHSHCYLAREGVSDPVPSYLDFERLSHKLYKGYVLFGICELRRYKSGRTYSKFSFWEARPPVKSNI